MNGSKDEDENTKAQRHENEITKEEELRYQNTYSLCSLRLKKRNDEAETF